MLMSHNAWIQKCKAINCVKCPTKEIYNDQCMDCAGLPSNPARKVARITLNKTIHHGIAIDSYKHSISWLTFSF